MAGRVRAALRRSLDAIGAATRTMGATMPIDEAQLVAHLLVLEKVASISADIPEVRGIERLREVVGSAELPPLSDRVFEELLRATDGVARRRRGAYYTPEPLAAAVVAAADEAVREHLGWGGLADGRVHVLDPAAGTGVFLRQVVARVARDGGARWPGLAADLASRLTGYEITPASHAICRSLLARAFSEFGGHVEGVDVRLADALAGEGAAANVVVGNPPWAGLGARTRETDRLLRDPIVLADGASIPGYYEVDGAPLGERKTWLQDDYIKFLRLAQRTVACAGQGVVALVTNHGWLESPTFRGVRASMLATFDQIDVIDLRGNAKRRDGDENVFEGVAQGAAIVVMTRSGKGRRVRHAELRGTRAEKLATLAAGPSLAPIEPHPPLFRFGRAAPRAPTCAYASWPSLVDLFPTRSTGIVTARDGVVFGLDDDEVLARISRLRDPAVGDEELRETMFRGKGSPRYPAGDSRGWKLPDARRALRDDPDWRARLRPCHYRPFDRRPLYYVPWMVDWPREAIMRDAGLSLVATRQLSVDEPWAMVAVADGLVESCFLSNRTAEICTVFPVDPDDERFLFALAVLHATAYRARFRERLAEDFPRVPPPTAPHDRRLIALGRRLVALYTARPAPPAEPATVTRALIDRLRAELPSDVWDFRVGAYHPIAKILKDRAGRTVDLAHVRAAAAAVAGLRTTIGAVDDAVRGLPWATSGAPGSVATRTPAADPS